MSDKTLNKVTTILIKAAGFLGNPDNWCPEGLGMNGVFLHKQCAVRALSYASGYGTSIKDHHDAMLELHDAATELGYQGSIHANKQGYDAVMKMYDLAINNSIQRNRNGKH